MKSPVRLSIVVVVLLAIATLTSCDPGQRLRLIRRITAADLPASGNETDAEPTSPTSQQGSSTARTITTSRQRVVPEVLATRETIHRRRRPIPTAPDARNSTELRNEVTDSPPTTSRRPYVPVTRNVARTRTTEAKTTNCTATGTCEQKTAANDEKSVKVKITATQEDTKKKTQKDKVQEVRPTDRTFNNIVSSSTARIVIQENIHTDILRHLTTPSYAHYETDYVLDEDPDSFEAESAPGKRATPSYDHYDTPSDRLNNTTPRGTVLFDEAYARVSEGIRQNLDDLVDRSEEYVASQSNESFESSEQGDGAETPPTSTKVALEYVNRVNVIANDSSTANSHHGDLLIDNSTHVDFERSSVQTKVIPEFSSTVKYLIDDVYSTTKRIPTKDVDNENNSIKGSATSAEDQQVVAAGGEAVLAKLEEPASSVAKREDATESGERIRVGDDQTTAKGESSDTSKPTEGRVLVEASPTAGANDEATPTTLRSNTLGRSRMFPSDRYYTYNLNNTVEHSATDNINKQDSRTGPTSSRTRRPIPTTEQYSLAASRRHIEEPTPTSPSRRPITRRPSGGESLRSVTSRGGVKYGIREPEVSDLYPIPPTAAAWSLATMKEPGRRPRPQNSTTTSTPPRHGEDDDSEASGSFQKQTTVYNILTPTPNSNSTDDKYWSRSTEKSYIVTTQPTIYIRDNVDLRVTTDNPSHEFTTTESSTTLPVDLGDASPTAHRPDDVTTSIPDEELFDDDDLRFDGITTRRSMQDDVEVTTLYPETENTSTTQGPRETTQQPREDVEKDEEREEDGESVTTESSSLGVAEDAEEMAVHVGSHDVQPETDHKDTEVGQRTPEDDVNKEEGHPSVEIQPERDAVGSQPQEEGPHVGELHPEEELKYNIDGKGHEETVPKHDDNHVGDLQPEGEGQDVHTGAKVHDVPTDSHDDGGHHVDVEADFGVSAVTEQPSSVAGSTDKPVQITTVVPAEVSKDTTTAATKEPPTPTPTPTPTTTTATPTTTEATRVVSDVRTFTRVFVESSMREFCDMQELFKKAVADLLTVGTGRTVSLEMVILRNIDYDTCAENSTEEAVAGQLIPVEMYIVNAAGSYDGDLNNAFPLLWGHSDLDFPLRIRKVDVVDESLTYSGGGSSGAVIAAITISCIGALSLLILAVLLVVMRKRQKKVNYGMRCTPVSLDAYSLDSVSIHGSTRRKGGVRASKRSYGNPAFDDPGSPSHPMNFATLTGFAEDRDGLEEEFSAIPHVTPNSDELPEGCETRNRYSNVIPLPETRVMLTLLEDEPLSDYINANYVRGPKNDMKCYIACQAPLQSTVTDFWRMVWEQQCKVVMMLTDLVENGVEKCADYLPPSEVLDCHRLFGDFQVTLKKREVREEYVISTLQLKNMESNSWREVTHLWYLSWPSQGVPEEASSVIAFLIEARSYMKNSAGPSVIHCSPGTGRTGTVLACDLGIREFEQTRLVDVPRCVARLRKDRAGCVQTRDQYAFIYKVLNLYATKLTGGALDSI